MKNEKVFKVKITNLKELKLAGSILEDILEDTSLKKDSDILQELLYVEGHSDVADLRIYSTVSKVMTKKEFEALQSMRNLAEEYATEEQLKIADKVLKRIKREIK